MILQLWKAAVVGSEIDQLNRPRTIWSSPACAQRPASREAVAPASQPGAGKISGFFGENDVESI